MTLKASTRCVHLPANGDPHGAMVPPIYQTATFRQPSALEFGEYDYTRSGNLTRTLLEQQLAMLEGGARLRFCQRHGRYHRIDPDSE